MNIKSKLVLLTVLVCGTGCAHGKGQAAPAHEPDAPLQAELAARVEQAREQREAIAHAIAQEDAPRNGKTKTSLVSAQVERALAQAVSTEPKAPYEADAVSAYEAACKELEAAYLESLLESTDPAQKPGAWSSDDGRDELGSATVDGKLAAWQALDPERPLVKFAVVRAPSGELVMRVGRLDVAHVDIAGGPALTAGLLRTSVLNGKTRVVVLENTSGGFRPGPLRNRTALAALRAAGYLPEEPSELTVHDNPSGGYDHSLLIPPKR